MQTLETGSAFGPYTIEGFVAGGGMGEVYAARHGVYGSVVALKVLHSDLHADDGWRRRFNEEGLVGTQLKHPHVLGARELIQHDGRVALVLDLIRGAQTLLRVVTREYATGVPLVQALQAFLAMLQGVEYLHVKGIVHGDIKPENVMLAGDFRDPIRWVPLVTDFGTVALIAHPVLIDGQPAVVASPRYASPEHLYGVDHLEVRSDIYALGLLLYFLLAGRHASDARNVEEAADRVMQPIPLLGIVDQPDAIIALVQKACALRPKDRFQNCREFALAIRRALDELGVKLELEDLQADLATEVMEERLRMREKADGRADEHTDLPTQPSNPPEAPPEAAKLTQPSGPPLPVATQQPTQEVVVPETPKRPVGPPRAPARLPTEDDDEPAVNPLWGKLDPDANPDDLSEAPTARFGPDRAAFEPPPPGDETGPPASQRTQTPRPVGVTAPAPKGSVPWMPVLGILVALFVIGVVVVLVVMGAG